MRRHASTFLAAFLLAPILMLFLSGSSIGAAAPPVVWSQDVWRRLLASILMALAAGAVATVLAVPLLPLLGRARSIARLWIVLPLVVLATPPYMIAAGLIALPTRLATVPGSRVLPAGITQDVQGMADLFFGPVGCLISYGLAYWPVPFLLAAVLRRPFCRGAESAALMLSERGLGTGAGRMVFLVLDWPRLWPGLLCGGLLVVALALGDYLVVEIHQVNTLMLDVSVRLSGHLDTAGAARLAAPVVLCIALTTIGMAMIIRRSAGWIGEPIGEDVGEAEQDFDQALSRLSYTPFLVLVILTAISLGLPLLGMALGVGSVVPMFKALATHRPHFMNTLLYSLGTAIALIFIGARLGMHWSESRDPPGRGARLVTLVSVVLFLIPAPLVGVGLAQLLSEIALFFRTIGLPIDFRVTRTTVVAGLCWRWLAVGMGLAWLLERRLKRPVARALATGMVPQRVRQCISWPSSARPLSIAFMVIVVLASGEAVVTKFLMPPGGDGLAVVFYDLLHYGQDETTATAGLLLLSVPMLVLLIVGRIWRRTSETRL